MPSSHPRSALLVLSLLCAGAAGSTARAGTAEPPLAAARRETIERVLAVVDGQPLLFSEVRTLAVVRGLEQGRALEEAIDERLMYAEASHLAEVEVGPGDETAALAVLVEREPALRSALSEPQLRRLVHRQIAILRYVEFRFRPQVRVSDEQVRREWEAEEVGRPSGLALEDAQQAIRARLERRALDERVEAWVGELRARADVRVVPPAPKPGPSTER